MTEDARYTLDLIQRDTDLCLEILREPVGDLLAVNVPRAVLAGVLVQLLIETARQDASASEILSAAIASIRGSSAA